MDTRAKRIQRVNRQAVQVGFQVTRNVAVIVRALLSAYKGAWHGN